MDQEVIEPIITPLGDVLLKPLTVHRTLTHTYPAPAIYTAAVWLNRLSITGALDTGHRFDVVIDVFDEPAMDEMFTQMWDGMHDALVTGDVPGALSYLTPEAQTRFEDVFQALVPHLPEIMQSYTFWQPVFVYPLLVGYALNRTIDGEDRIFLIYFARDDEGIWKLVSM